MAKSKLVQMNTKIEKQLETGLQKISNRVVGSYTKIEDKFVDQYLTKEGESIDQAKLRLKKEQAQRKEKSIKEKQ